MIPMLKMGPPRRRPKKGDPDDDGSDDSGSDAGGKPPRKPKKQPPSDDPDGGDSHRKTKGDLGLEFAVGPEHQEGDKALSVSPGARQGTTRP